MILPLMLISSEIDTGIWICRIIDDMLKVIRVTKQLLIYPAMKVREFAR
ncbi:hypothetical protein T266_08320 [Pseudomonas aeruginosa VRFPA05]|nr:hypothetical protein T266_08320 [Pseudomonas aeruginosa VRFPA05]